MTERDSAFAPSQLPPEGAPEPDKPSGPVLQGSSPGGMLRQLREAAGVDPALVASAMKVSLQKLDALENDRFDELPDLTFARGLASAICRAFGADPAPADKTPFDLHFTVGDLVQSETTTFTGADGDPWPAPWVAERVPATGGAVRIASGEGELVTGATGSYSTLDTVAVRYGDHNSPDSSWTFTWRIVGASSYPRVVARSDAANLDPSEAVLVGWSTTSIDVVSAVAGEFVTTATTAKTHSLDTEYGARIVFAGSTVRARTWLATGPEPDTWDVEAQVANVGAGYMGVSVGGANSATNRTFRIDDLAVVTGTDMSTGGGYGSDYGQNYGG